MRLADHFRSSVCAMVCSAMAGCTGATLPSLNETLSQLDEAETNPVIVGPPTDIYARLARGAKTCWFGREGPLKADYVYFASADPPSKGGKAKIVIRWRDRQSEDQGGLRAYSIQIFPEKESSKLVIENIKLPEAQAESMERDVRRWAAGELGCNEEKADETWSAEAAKPADKSKSKSSAPAKKK